MLGSIAPRPRYRAISASSATGLAVLAASFISSILVGVVVQDPRASLDAVRAHLVDVEQQALAVARGVVDDRAVHRPLVLDGLRQVPQSAGAAGIGRSLLGSWTSGSRFRGCGVGPPMISVSRPTELWK